MIITRVRIVLGDGKEQGQVYLQTKFGTAIVEKALGTNNP